jgi:hypothetical protein
MSHRMKQRQLAAYRATGSDLGLRETPRGFAARRSLVGAYRILKYGLLICAQATLFALVLVGYVIASCFLLPWRLMRRP